MVKLSELIYTKFFGKFVGKDEFGNTYFTNGDGKKDGSIIEGSVMQSRISPYLAQLDTQNY